MPDGVNPYESPRAEIVADQAVSAGRLTEAMVFSLKAASPWIVFQAIMGFVGAGSMVLGGLVCMGVSPFIPAASGLRSGGFTEAWAGPAFIAMGLFMIALAVLVFFPARFLYHFGTGIRNFTRSNSEAELEAALKSNRAYWKFQGILIIVSMAGGPLLMMVISVVLALGASMR